MRSSATWQGRPNALPGHAAARHVGHLLECGVAIACRAKICSSHQAQGVSQLHMESSGKFKGPVAVSGCPAGPLPLAAFTPPLIKWTARLRLLDGCLGP